jgi:hypothetical protein
LHNLFKYFIYKKILNSSYITSAFNDCQFDMCALESNSTQQNGMRCSSYTSFVSSCYAEAKKRNLIINITGWRTLTNCRKLHKFTYNNINLFYKIILRKYFYLIVKKIYFYSCNL